jgi:hypothetical protein
MDHLAASPTTYISVVRHRRCWNSWTPSLQKVCWYTTKQRFRYDYGTSYSSFFIDVIPQCQVSPRTHCVLSKLGPMCQDQSRWVFRITRSSLVLSLSPLTLVSCIAWPWRGQRFSHSVAFQNLHSADPSSEVCCGMTQLNGPLATNTLTYLESYNRGERNWIIYKPGHSTMTLK